jgi:hypothetical protein
LAPPLATPHIKTTVPKESARRWEGSIDVFNGRRIPVENSEVNPIRLSSHIEVQGWAATSVKSGEAFDATYLAFGDKLFKATTLARPDVAQYTGNPHLEKSGFRIACDVREVPKGAYLLRIIGATRDGRYYACPYRVYLRVD